MSYFKKIAFGTFHSISAMVIIRILSIISSVIIVRLLGPVNLGIYSIFQNIHAIFDSLSQSSSSTSIVKYTAEYRKVNKKVLETFLSTAVISLFCMSVSIGILYFLLSDIIANKIYAEPIIALLMKISSITLVLSVFINIGTGILQGLQKIKQVAMLSIINTVIAIPVTYFFIVQMGLVGAVISSIMCALINISFAFYLVRKYLKVENIQPKVEVKKTHITELFNYSLPLFLGTIILRPARLYGQTLLALTHDFAEVGYFKVAFGLYNLMSFLPAAISVPLLPLVSEIHASKTIEHSYIYSKILKIVILVVLPASIVTGLLSKYIIIGLYSDKYIDAIFIAHLMIISAFFGSITSLLENLLLGIGKTWKILYTNIYMSVTFVLSSYFFIRNYGPIGLGMAWLIVDATLLPFYLYYAHKKSYINLSLLKLPLILSIMFLSISFIVQIYLDGVQLVFFTICYLFLILIIEYIILDEHEKKIIWNLLYYRIKG